MEGLRKKAKVLADEEYETKNFASVLTKPFLLDKESVQVYFYRFAEVKGFGLLLSVEFIPCPDILQYVDVRYISKATYEDTKRFQNVFWSDLFQVRPEEETEEKTSEACYLIVPLKGKSISWKSVKRAIGKLPKINLLLIPAILRHKCIVTKTDSHSTFYYLSRITNHSSFLRIIEKLPMKSLYSQTIPTALDDDISERISELVKDFKINQFRSHASLALLRKARVARRNPTPTGLKKPNPNSLILIAEDTLQVHYLARRHFRNSTKLVKALIEVERYSYLIEFQQQFQYTGDFRTIRNATTAPIYDNSQNYDSLNIHRLN